MFDAILQWLMSTFSGAGTPALLDAVQKLSRSRSDREKAFFLLKLMMDIELYLEKLIIQLKLFRDKLSTEINVKNRDRLRYREIDNMIKELIYASIRFNSSLNRFTRYSRNVGYYLTAYIPKTMERVDLAVDSNKVTNNLLEEFLLVDAELLNDVKKSIKDKRALVPLSQRQLARLNTVIRQAEANLVQLRIAKNNYQVFLAKTFPININT